MIGGPAETHLHLGLDIDRWPLSVGVGYSCLSVVTVTTRSFRWSRWRVHCWAQGSHPWFGWTFLPSPILLLLRTAGASDLERPRTV